MSLRPFSSTYVYEFKVSIETQSQKKKNVTSKSDIISVWEIEKREPTQ